MKNKAIIIACSLFAAGLFVGVTVLGANELGLIGNAGEDTGNAIALVEDIDHYDAAEVQKQIDSLPATGGCCGARP